MDEHKITGEGWVLELNQPYHLIDDTQGNFMIKKSN